MPLVQHKLPPLRLRTIGQNRSTIYERWLRHMLGTSVTAEASQRLAAGASRLLKVPQDHVFESVRGLAGTQPTEGMLRKLAWRLAANIPALKKGPVHTWSLQPYDEWVPAQIMRHDRYRRKDRKVVNRYRLLILAGLPATEETYVSWSRRAARFVANQIGFSRAYRFSHPAELVGLRAFVRISAQNSKERPEVSEVAGCSSLQQWNRENVLRVRLRYEASCPRRYRHPCTRCSVGYDLCPAGVHARTYERGTCYGCADENAYFDPEMSLSKCVTCIAKELFHVDNADEVS